MGLVIAVATIAGYGTLWWIIGTWAAGQGSWVGDACAVLLLVLLLSGAWRRRPSDPPERRPERARRGYIIGVVTGVQAVLILLTLHLLHAVDRTDLFAPAVAIFMGLHFLAFARWFPARLYYLTSALLVGLGAIGLLVAAGAIRLLTVSIGAACILWLTCVAVLIWPGSRRKAM